MKHMQQKQYDSLAAVQTTNSRERSPAPTDHHLLENSLLMASATTTKNPQPNYPNFEPKKQASQVTHILSQPRMGDIGWGVGKFEAPKGQYDNYSSLMLENKNKNHIAYCNHLDN